jgi:hypothetical protein
MIIFEKYPPVKPIIRLTQAPLLKGGWGDLAVGFCSSTQPTTLVGWASLPAQIYLIKMKCTVLNYFYLLNTMLNHLQQVTLQAFITALAELDSPLPADFQKQINQVGAIFSTQPNVAIDELLKLAKHPSINQLYLQARVNIQSEYETKERNINYRDYEQESQNLDTSIDALENVAKSIPVLQAPDSVESAKKYKRETKQNKRWGWL